MMLGTAEATEIKKALLRAREGNTHAIEEINYRGRQFAHRFRRWLVCKKVSTINCVVEMLPRGVAFSFGVNGAVDATLRANGVAVRISMCSIRRWASG